MFSYIDVVPNCLIHIFVYIHKQVLLLAKVLFAIDCGEYRDTQMFTVNDKGELSSHLHYLIYDSKYHT